MFKRAFSKSIKPVVVFIVYAVMLSDSGRLYAQEAAPAPTPPKSPEVQRLEEEKGQAELRKAIAEAEKAELAAKFPAPTTTPLAGATTINDTAIIETQMIAHVRMAMAAKEIIKQLNGTAANGKDKGLTTKGENNGTKDENKAETLTINKLAIYNPNDVNLLLSYRTSLNQMRLIRTGYQKLIIDKPQDCVPTADEPGIRPQVLTEEIRSALAGVLPTMTAIQSVFGKFIDMTALLRTNVDIKGTTFDLDEAALISEVFRAAKSPDGLKNVTLYWPAVFPPNLNLEADSPILKELDALDLIRAYTEGLAKALEDTQKKVKDAEGQIKSLNAKVKDLRLRETQAKKEITRIENTYGRVEDRNGRRRRGVPPEVFERKLRLDDTVKELQEEIEAIEKPGEGELHLANVKKVALEITRACLLLRLQPEFRDLDKLDDTIARLRAQNAHFTKFIEAIIKADSPAGLNPLTTFIKAESLLAALEGAGSYWLQLKVLKAGGNNRIKTNLLWDIFTGGQRLSHSGGAIVEYILYNKNGEATRSDTVTSYSNYIKAKKVKDLPNP